MAKNKQSPENKLSPVHGLLLVDKPSGMTSHDVVDEARKILGIRAVGHTGTLDPLASGLMVLLIGEATKLSDYFRDGDKGYRVCVEFGKRTDSLDRTGQVIEQVDDVCVDADTLKKEVAALSGVFRWPVPIYSAVKVSGKRLYEKARSQQEHQVDIPLREMAFYDVELQEFDNKTAWIELRCSKGSYIRSWAKELGERMGCGACVAELRRNFSSPYTIERAISLVDLARHQVDFLEKNEQQKNDQEISSQWLNHTLGEAWIPMSAALPQLAGVTVTGKDENLLRHGQVSYALQKRLLVEQKQANSTRQERFIRVISGSSQQLLALLLVSPFNNPKIRRIFNI